LGTSKELFERTERIFGKGWKPEIDTMDTFACSSWYFFRFADPHNDKAFASKEALQKWLPVDLYVGGAEHTVLHLLYARFYTKALRDMGYLSFDEPFLKMRHQGIILAEDSRKMSKRWGNVINPDDMVERFGADSVRLYEMFMGPLDAMKPWNTDNVMGVRRFLERVWNLQEKLSDAAPSAETETALHQTIDKVTKDIETLKMNTAISALMIYSNHLHDLKEIPKAAYGPFLKLLTPFAPHMTSEIAATAGYPDGAIDTWPAFDSSKIVASSVTIAVQINGKVRASIELTPDTSQEDALTTARANPNVAKWLSSVQEKKAVYIPGKIINFVVG
jgi:leucyl-tRNA synthetase